MSRRLAHLGALRGDLWLPLLGVLALGGAVAATLADPATPTVVPALGLLAFLAARGGTPLVALPWPPPPRVWRWNPPQGLPDPGDDPSGPPPSGSSRQEYRWRFRVDPLRAETEADEAVQLDLRESEWRAAAARERLEPSGGRDAYPRYVTEGLAEEVRVLAHRLARRAERRGLTPLQTANYVLAFCSDPRNLPYASDADTHGAAQYANYPIETLWERRGDCEDHAILAAALYRRLGFEVILLWVEPKAGGAHLAVGVALPFDLPGAFLEFRGRRYFYGEATPAGRHALGEASADIRDASASWVPLPL